MIALPELQKTILLKGTVLFDNLECYPADKVRRWVHALADLQRELLDSIKCGIPKKDVRRREEELAALLLKEMYGVIGDEA